MNVRYNKILIENIANDYFKPREYPSNLHFNIRINSYGRVFFSKIGIAKPYQNKTNKGDHFDNEDNDDDNDHTDQYDQKELNYTIDVKKVSDNDDISICTDSKQTDVENEMKFQFKSFFLPNTKVTQTYTTSVIMNSTFPTKFKDLNLKLRNDDANEDFFSCQLYSLYSSEPIEETTFNNMNANRKKNN